MGSKIITVFLSRLNVPKAEIGDFTEKIDRREFTMLFDSFEAYDVAIRYAPDYDINKITEEVMNQSSQNI